jgi:uncharacterized protein
MELQRCESGAFEAGLPAKRSSLPNSQICPPPRAGASWRLKPSSHFNQVIDQQINNRSIAPMDLHHPILREFPEHREAIKRLKGTNEHFRSVFDEYHRLDDEIYRIEEEIGYATDQETEELKMRRAKLKDYIYHVIRHAPPVCPSCEGSGVAR